MRERSVFLSVALALLLVAGGCATTETYVARCSVGIEQIDGGGDAKVGDYVAYMGRGVLIHLDTLDASAADGSIVVEQGGANPTVSGNRKDARVLSVKVDTVELGVLNGDLASYVANSNLCRR